MGRKITLVACLAALFSFSAVALASDQFTQKLGVTYTANKESTASGLKASLIGSDPGEPGGKPRAVSQVKIDFNGASFNLNAAEKCTKSSTDMLNGKCPSKSKVGTGTAIANASPVVMNQVIEDVTAYNVAGGVDFALKRRGLGTNLVIKGKIKGDTLTVKVPRLTVGVTDIVLTDFSVNIKNIQSKTKSKKRIAYLKTPKKCTGGKFTSTGTFTYFDGPQVVVTANSPCKS